MSAVSRFCSVRALTSKYSEAPHSAAALRPGRHRSTSQHSVRSDCRMRSAYCTFFCGHRLVRSAFTIISRRAMEAVCQIEWQAHPCSHQSRRSSLFPSTTTTGLSVLSINPATAATTVSQPHGQCSAQETRETHASWPFHFWNCWNHRTISSMLSRSYRENTKNTISAPRQ